MAVTHISTTHFGSASATGSFNVTIPAAGTTGRLLVAVVTQGASAAPTLTTPTGWSAGPVISYNSSLNQTALFYRLSSNTQSTSVTFASNQTTGNIYVEVSIWDGVDQTTPWTNGGTGSGTMSTSTTTIPTVTTTVANAFMFGHSVFQSASGTATEGTMTETLDTAAGSYRQVEAYESIPVAGATGTRTFTFTTSAALWAALSGAINPSAGAATAYSQTTFRGRNDDGTETTATWKATAGTNWTQDVDTNFRVRFNINGATVAPTQNTAFVLRYSLNGGAYTAVSGASSVVRAFASANVTDGTATTEQLAGAGTFNAGTIDEADGSATGFTAVTAAGQDTEVEYVVQIRSVDVADGNTIGLQVYRGTTALDTYTATPSITVNVPAPPTVEPIYPTMQPPIAA